MEDSKIKNWLILSLLGVIGLLLLLRQCQGPEVKETFLKGSEIILWDTVKQPYKVVELKKVYYPKYDTIKLADTTWNADLCKFERTYTDSIADTNITIFSTVETVGILKSSKVAYRWKKPEVVRTINRIDTLVRPSRLSLYIGLELAGNEASFNASPYLSLNYKKTNIGVSYGLLDKTVGIRVGYRLFKSKK